MDYEGVNCIICDKEFGRAKSKVNTGFRNGLKRGARNIKSKTCSKKCSRIYNYKTYEERKELNSQSETKNR